ncbi:hypothetical protein R1flu_028448 [Riccia fluitans]|uniref:Uncharacterized protein n=1 Tax=Riccia fluitans TaxID=41844 RepID=A0ABD1XLQ4_9MARC
MHMRFSLPGFLPGGRVVSDQESEWNLSWIPLVHLQLLGSPGSELENERWSAVEESPAWCSKLRTPDSVDVPSRISIFDGEGVQCGFEIIINQPGFVNFRLSRALKRSSSRSSFPHLFDDQPNIHLVPEFCGRKESHPCGVTVSGS